MPAATRPTIAAWFAGRVPDQWFTGPPAVDADREEILVVGTIDEPEVAALPDDDAAEHDARAAARLARVRRFREETRDARIRIAEEAEHLFDRKVSWGARCGDERHVFTNLAVPVMTRLRMDERAVLDTLIDGGVARSRSEALAWCVRLVASNEGEWIARLREALIHVEEVRERRPAS